MSIDPNLVSSGVPLRTVAFLSVPSYTRDVPSCTVLQFNSINLEIRNKNPNSDMNTVKFQIKFELKYRYLKSNILKFGAKFLFRHA